MAITKLNSLAIPDDTIVEADLSYPLTNFSSTGIDDNASSTAVTIDSSQNVSMTGGVLAASFAVNNNSGNAPLQIHTVDSNSAYMQFTNATTGDTASNGLVVGFDGNEDAYVWNYENNALYFGTANTKRMHITNTGGVGIGTDSVSNKLEVDGGSSPVFARISTTNAGGKVAGLILANSGKTAFNDGVKISHGSGYTTFDDLAGTTNFIINQTDGRVGVGTTNPRYNFAVKGSNSTAVGIAVDNDAGGCQLDVAALGSTYNAHGAQPNEAWLFCANNINLGSATGQSSAVKFLSGGSENARIDSDGIKFNADTAAANGLDDYEEGTWSPTLPNGGSITVNRAVYTKVGRLVIANLYISISSIPNDSADFRIGNLPFNSGIATDYGGGSLSYAANRDVRGWSDPLVLQQASVLYFHFLDGTTGNPVKNTNVVSSLVATLIAQVVYFAS